MRGAGGATCVNVGAMENVRFLYQGKDGAGVRPAAVAGAFYPGDADGLRRTLASLMERVPASDAPVPKAIIAPHAGYIYSGLTAAIAYARLAPAGHVIKRVVLLGPCHRVGVDGIAACSAAAFATPLGDIAVDQAAIGRLLELPFVKVFDDTHEAEHSLEVHLPFLQTVLDDFQLVPLVVGQARPEQVAAVLEMLWGGPETVIVVSSDLSHYHDYTSARGLDDLTRQMIENLDYRKLSGHHACGRFPVSGLLEVARRRAMTVSTLDMRNSGDTAGAKERVVGYGAWAFCEAASAAGGARQAAAEDSEDSFGRATKELLARFGERLLGLAARSIMHGLEHGAPLQPEAGHYPAPLVDIGACFVTLKRQGRLRGCIGSPQAHRPLLTDVTENAFKAAFKDPRFAPLTAPELDALEVSISVLGPAQAMRFRSEADFMDQLRPGIDGLIIEDAGRRALFLPSVWEQLPDKQQFVSHLKAKAGLKPGHWSETFRASRFVAEEMHAADLADPQAIWPKGHGKG